MKFRILGRTGFKVSELGLGGHEYVRFTNPYHFPSGRETEEEVSPESLLIGQEERTNLIMNAIDAGINYFDTTLVEEAQSLGLALKTLKKRDEVYIAAQIVHPFRKMGDKPRSTWREIVEDGVENRLRILNTGHLDVFNVHTPENNYSNEKLESMIDSLKNLKREEKIFAVGASSHQPAFLAELIRKHDCFDTVMVPYNYNTQKAREVLFPLCKNFNIGIVVMKPFAWPFYGIPFTYFQPSDIQSSNSLFCTSLRWILQSQEVSTIVPGINTIKELEENLSAFMKEEEMDESLLSQCLEIAKSQESEAKLKDLSLRKNSRIDISEYAKRALQQRAK